MSAIVCGRSKAIRVRRGDSLSVIASRIGISDWQGIYDAPCNAAFRSKFPDPNKIDYVLHGKAVQLYVPCEILWKRQTFDIVGANRRSAVAPASAPAGSVRKVAKIETGATRHSAQYQVFRDKETPGTEFKATRPYEGEVPFDALAFVAKIKWKIEVKGAFGTSPEGKLKLGERPDDERAVKISSDGEALALDLLGVLSMEMGKHVINLSSGTPISSGFESEPGWAGVSAKVARSVSVYDVRYKVETKVTAYASPVPGVWRANLKYSLDPVVEGFPYGFGNSTVEIDITTRPYALAFAVAAAMTRTPTQGNAEKREWDWGWVYGVTGLAASALATIATTAVQTTESDAELVEQIEENAPTVAGWGGSVLTLLEIGAALLL